MRMKKSTPGSYWNSVTYRTVSALCVAIAVGSASLRAQSPAASVIPKTAAGEALSAWLDAFNSDDSTRMATYLRTYQPERTVRDALYFRQMSGGFDLVTIERSEPRHIEFTLRERNSPMIGYGAMDVSAGEPTRVTGSMLEPLGPSVSVAALRINASARTRVVDGAAALLDSFYVSPDVAKRMGDSIRTLLAHGVYDTYGGGPGFAMRLNRDLGDIAHDKHLRVDYSVRVLLPQRAQSATSRTA